MKVAIVTDAWLQVNGVVKTLTKVKEGLESRGYEVSIISHDRFKTYPCPSYPEIMLAVNPWNIGRIIKQENPDFIHIATEGPLGLFAKLWCDRREIPYSTSYHTMFPEYLKSGFRIPLNLTYRYFRWFHGNSQGVLVPTESCKKILDGRGFKNVRVWTRGVNHDLFHPNYEDVYEGLERPIMVNVGRVSQEKGLDDFLSIDIPKGTKVLVGDGPMLDTYKKKYPDVVYRGYKHGPELAAHFAAADIFVFPSKTDTFGLVNVEAMACGTPVIAYDVQGPRDIINKDVGWLAENFGDFKQFCMFCHQFLEGKKENCISYAQNYTWENCVDIFEENLCYVR
jgi:glycosyltransferase involved in cell wall biosynthesis